MNQALFEALKSYAASQILTSGDLVIRVVIRGGEPGHMFVRVEENVPYTNNTKRLKGGAGR